MTNVRSLPAAVRPSPIFLFIVGVFALSGVALWRYGAEFPPPRGARLLVFLFVVAGWIVSLCLHEFGHAYFAYRSGDHSVATRGYLTLNPMKYGEVTLSFILPVLFVLIGGIGLPGGAVYINRGAIPGRIRHSLISLAGPLANLLFAVVLGLILPASGSAAFDHSAFWAAVAFLGFLQVTAAILNLLPVPGLDGFGIWEPYLPRHIVRAANQIGGYAFFILLALLWLPPVNHAFFDGVAHVTNALGIDSSAVDAGHTWFRFWSRDTF